MVNNTKNIARASFCAALCAALAVAGCSKSSSSTGDNGDKTTITVWEQMEPQGRLAFESVVAQFNQANPNIVVQVVHYQNEDLRTNFQNAALTGAGPDLVYGPSDTIGIFHTSDLIAPVGSFIDQKLLDSLDAKALQSGGLDGQEYMIPDINGNQLAMVYNQKLVPQAPKTWNELLAATSKLQNPAAKTFGFAYNEKEPYWFAGFYLGMGGKLLDDKNQPSLDNQAMIDSLQFVKDVKSKYHLGFNGMDYDQVHQLFKDGKIGVIINGSWSWSDYASAGIKVGIAPMVTLPNGSQPVFLSSTKGFMISKNEQTQAKKTAINQFLAYDLSPENNAKYALSQSQVPTVKLALDLPEVQQNPLLQASIQTLKYTQPMPIVPQMRGVWDAMRPNLEAVINGKLSPQEAAKKMQQDALQGVKTIQGK